MTRTRARCSRTTNAGTPCTKGVWGARLEDGMCYGHHPDNPTVLQALTEGRNRRHALPELDPDDFESYSIEGVASILDALLVGNMAAAKANAALSASEILRRLLIRNVTTSVVHVAEGRYNLRPPVPTPIQIKIISSDKRRICLAMGRRAGKTTLAALQSVRLAKEDARVLYACPTADQTDAYWEKVKKYCEEWTNSGIAIKSESNRTIIFPGGGRIKAKTAWDADTLRGDYADFLILDEFAYMNPDAWEKVGQPMLLDNNGTVWFISTPQFRNHFFVLFTKCATNERWDAFHCTSHDNPHLSREALEDLAEDMTEDAYQQEIMAEFLEGEGSIFKNIDANLTAPVDEHPSDHKGHRIVFGADWGKHKDYTSFSIGCADCKQELVLYRSNDQTYSFQKERLIALHKRWGFDQGIGELNSMGEPIVEDLEGKIPITGFMMTNKNKKRLVEQLQLSLEQEEWRFLPDKIGKYELMAFAAKVSKAGNIQFSGSPHDDTVISRMLMLEADVPVFVFA